MLSIIAAVSENNALGKDNKLLWHLPADLKRLKALTMGHYLIMGRKTFESIGRPLPGRPHVIISRNEDRQLEGVTVVNSLDKALDLAKDDDQPFIFGGGEIYRIAMHLVQRIYLTRVHKYFEGDAYFPELDPKEWQLVEKQDFEADEKNLMAYSYEEYKRIS
ncbi:MAG: dihydrofolate reductase [Bacteroidetes bacterium]|jgi:dihydrofolate reductase|nr:dihydrofolate reductase [Bacteroidota bacterium]